MVMGWESIYELPLHQPAGKGAIYAPAMLENRKRCANVLEDEGKM